MAKEPADKERINALISEIRRTVDLICGDRHSQARRKHLAQLKNGMAALAEMCDALPQYEASPAAPPAASPPVTQRVFTHAELAQYNGKSGNPAYTAVNGVVYDVTNNAAWAAATHFGLSAGNDLTNQYSTCHAGQRALAGLAIVGSLADG